MKRRKILIKNECFVNKNHNIRVLMFPRKYQHISNSIEARDKPKFVSRVESVTTTVAEKKVSTPST